MDAAASGWAPSTWDRWKATTLAAFGTERRSARAAGFIFSRKVAQSLCSQLRFGCGWGSMCRDRLVDAKCGREIQYCAFRDSRMPILKKGAFCNRMLQTPFSLYWTLFSCSTETILNTATHRTACTDRARPPCCQEPFSTERLLRAAGYSPQHHPLKLPRG